jgi:HPt (histidine-containing phosphotransfer) domain-containing protein/ActR/RegA family two-component response regulator
MSTILILDDDRIFRRQVAESLEQRGHRVLEAGRASDADRLLRGETPDLFLVDGLLPDTTGVKWLEKHRRAGRKTPVLFVSAFWKTLRDFDAVTKKLGTELLRKPIEPAVVADRVEAALGVRAPSSRTAEPSRRSEPAAAAQASDLPAEVLDEKALRTLLADDPDLLHELTGLFEEDAPALLREMDAALASADWPTLQRAAHTLKGSTGSLCGRRAAEACLRLEKLADEKALAPARRTFAILQAEVGKLRRALARLALGSPA